jgi:uncharacterized phage infection (PIP) family protein YhgE
MNSSKAEESLFLDRLEKLNKVKLEKDYVLSQLLKRTQLFEQASDEAAKQKKEANQAKNAKAKAVKELEKANKVSADLDQKLSGASQELDRLSRKVKRLNEEYSILLDQMFKVQEQFESHLKDNYKFRKELEVKNKKLAQLGQQNIEFQTLLNRYQQAVLTNKPKPPQAPFLQKIFSGFTNQISKEDIDLVTSSKYFDEQWYLLQNPDVALSGMSAVEHYLLHGGQEGRASGPNFCSASYIKNYPDVDDAGVNPLLHYLIHGKEEGRRVFAV